MSELPINRIFVDGHGMCEVWTLPKVSPKKQRRGKYVQESFVHPAKMDVVLCHKIIETYTEPGETVLDPMSGIFTTGIEAMLLGRNAVGVELEDKFVKLSEQNIELIEKAQTLTPKGKAVVIKGDSRELSKLLGEKADVAVFSPPYAESLSEKAGGMAGEWDKDGTCIKKKLPSPYSANNANIGNLKYGKPVDAIVTSPPFAEAQRGGGIAKHGYDGPKHTKTDLVGRRSYMPENVGDGEGNIARMPYGKVDTIVTSPPYAPMGDRQNGKKIAKSLAKHDAIRGFAAGGSFRGSYGTDDRRNVGNPRKYGRVDAVITSPPYSESMSKKRKGYTTHPELSKTRHMGLGSSDENIGNLRHGKVDSIITSPPYEESMGKKHHSPRADQIAEEKSLPTTYTERVDTIVTSPPYEGSLEATSRHTKGGIPARDKQLGQTGFYPSENPENIGNLKNETYLEAMFQVYRECYKTLKPGGKMVLVIKDFVRAKKVVRLDLDTKRLCEAVGFRWVETKLFKLPGRSFWRTLYARKYPEVDTSLLRFEFVEVFERPPGVFT